MENISKKIGIIGGGQLGKMMVLEAKKMGFYVSIIDPTKKCPASSIVDNHIIADFNDLDAIKNLCEISDVVTYEFEHINAQILNELEDAGKKIYPTAKSLLIIQNKLSQKNKLKENNIKMSDYVKVESVNDIKNASDKFNLPVVLKTCTGGYDGKGNYLIKTLDDIDIAFKTLGSGEIPLMIEAFYPFIKEISVLACRGIDGDIKIYTVAENNHKNNILIETIVPANISDETTKNAMNLAKNVMEIFQGVGMFCVEMFVDKDGDVALNEVAPRPHNSGHYTIDACITNQFEQHIRAITALPLGNPSLIKSAVMRNILGEDGFNGNALVLGANHCLTYENAKLHIYGKEQSSPHRKMGHITIIDDDISVAIKNAEDIMKHLKITGDKKI